MTGFADHSYGIQVAQMAGIPDEITERAKQILQNLESSELRLASSPQEHGESIQTLQLTMFDSGEYKIRETLESIDINSMTPLEALHTLAQLIEIVKKMK
jgi:DNA mismatch repair protein MutS